MSIVKVINDIVDSQTKLLLVACDNDLELSYLIVNSIHSRIANELQMAAVKKDIRENAIRNPFKESN